jgi:uncharacterized membrane protein YqjE
MQRDYQDDVGDRPQSRSLGTLLSDLTNQLTTLVRQEIELAKVEMSQKLTALGKDAMMIGAGAAMLYAGFLGLLAAAAVILSLWMPAWLAVLIVAVVVLGVGAAVFVSGKNRLKKRDIKPTQTIISLKENKRWIQQKT